jgi:hypothetical protein
VPSVEEIAAAMIQVQMNELKKAETLADFNGKNVSDCTEDELQNLLALAPRDHWLNVAGTLRAAGASHMYWHFVGRCIISKIFRHIPG